MDRLNVTRVEGVNVCARCHGPVEYLDTRSDPEAVCGVCARQYSAHDSGIVIEAINCLVRPVNSLSEVGMSRAGIVAIVDAVLEKASRRPCIDDGDLMDLDPPGYPGWARGLFEEDTRFRPLDGSES